MRKDLRIGKLTIISPWPVHFNFKTTVHNNPMTLRLHCNVFSVENLNKLFLAFCLFIAGHAFAQPGIEYDKIYEMQGIKMDTKDGGFLILGDGDHNNDYHIAKHNAAGTLEWEKTYKGNGADNLKSVIQTSDGGYLLGGYSNSNKGLDKSENTYDTDDVDIFDYWIIKITADGTKQWDRTLGGSGVDLFISMLETSDGGYLIGGNSNSPVSAVKTMPAIIHYNYNSSTFDYWLVKLASGGDLQWDKRIGGNGSEKLVSMRATSDGGYLLAGTSSSRIGYDKDIDTRGENDFWIVKITSAGLKISENVYGGSSSDDLISFEPTFDGGFILGGTSGSEPGGEKTSQHFGPADYIDYWLVKVNAALEKQWDSTYGGVDHDFFISASQTPDAGYIIIGSSRSEPAGNRTAVRQGNEDLWVIKTNVNGVIEWDKSLSDRSGNYYNVSIKLVADGGYLIQTSSSSRGPIDDKTSYGFGLWEIKLLADFNQKKLSFSKPSLAFNLQPYAPEPAAPKYVTLSANTGNPSPTLVKNAPDNWVLLPAPALGSLPITVDGSEFRNGEYNASVIAVAPGYERAILPISLLSVDSTMLPVLYGVTNETIIENVPLTFTADANVQIGQTKIFSLENAPEGAAINPSTGVFKWTPVVPGVYKFTVKVTADTSPLLTDEEEITVTVLRETSNDIVRINAGGGAYTTKDGRQFIADQYFNGNDRTSSNDTVDILNTEDDELYRSGRAATSFGYTIPVRKGVVKVTLHFAEIYWGVFPNRPKSTGQRRFEVEAEGAVILSNYDISAKAGGPLQAVQESFEVMVLDGALNLVFIGYKDLARISAIEVERLEPQTNVVLAPVADAFVRKGKFSNNNFGSELTLDCKTGTSKDLDRVSFLKFSLAPFSKIEYAKLRIYGYNYEGSRLIPLEVWGLEDDNWTENGITAANAPEDPGTYLEGIYVTRHKNYLEIDVKDFAQAQIDGNKILTFMIKTASPSNARVVFNSRENAINPPQLEIISIGPVNSEARLAAQETMPEDKSDPNASSVYPNPVKDRIMVNISSRHSADLRLQLFNVLGNCFQVETENGITPGGKVDLDISNLALRSGLYLLKVHSEKHSEVLRVLVAE